MDRDFREYDKAPKEDRPIFPYNGGKISAYRAWQESERLGEDILIVRELPWEVDSGAADFVLTLIAAGIQDFVVTDSSTALMRMLHKLSACGCRIVGLWKKEATGNEEDWFEYYPAIEGILCTLKEEK